MSFFTPSNLFFGGLVAGPVPCPADFIADEAIFRARMDRLLARARAGEGLARRPG